MESSSSVADASDREIVTTRTFAAPRERVFAAWARSENLERWWGPQGFTTTTHAFDFRPGGEWKHTMHGPDGRDYRNRIVYDEIVAGQRIVYSHQGEGVDAQVHFQQTVTFVARGEKTELTMRSKFPSPAARDQAVKQYHASEGAKQTLARLSEELETRAPDLRMERLFKAPRDLVFQAWTKAEYVSRWFTPAPLTTPSCTVDCRPGGVLRVVMRMPDGLELPFEGRFREVVKPERIVFEGTMPDGNAVVTTVTFTEQDKQTLLQVLQTYTFASDSTRGARAGWTATLDQLGVVVAEIAASA